MWETSNEMFPRPVDDKKTGEQTEADRRDDAPSLHS